MTYTMNPFEREYFENLYQSRLRKATNDLRYLGNYFGYPDCCIEDFCKRPDASTITEVQRAVHNGNGFIPCPSCAHKVLTGVTTIKKLIDPEKRKAARPYPYGSINSLDTNCNV